MKLYVGNIPYDTTEGEVRALFQAYEPLNDFFYPNDKFTGRPRGFAFVTVGSREIGEQVIEQLDGSDCGGRNLRVSEAREREQR